MERSKQTVGKLEGSSTIVDEVPELIALPNGLTLLLSFKVLEKVASRSSIV